MEKNREARVMTVYPPYRAFTSNQMLPVQVVPFLESYLDIVIS
jgi:hypothetical protein